MTAPERSASRRLDPRNTVSNKYAFEILSKGRAIESSISKIVIDFKYEEGQTQDGFPLAHTLCELGW